MPASRSTRRRAPLDAFADDLHTIQYTYDAISRLLEADYYPGLNVNAAPFRENAYGFDLAGNLTNLNGVSRTYNAANQLVNDGTNTLTYDANGNMTSDGANAHTWDRANRLLSMGGIEYAYNGNNNRVTQTANSIVTQYLLDMQPGLALVLGDSDGNHYIHSPRGIHAVIDGSDWTYPVQDARGSVRGYADENSAVVSNVNYSEYGLPDVAWKGWAFTGEWRDANPLQYHRARYYAPGIGVWASLDPFEGLIDRPMSLNRYGYVNGNPVNLVDLSGNCPENPGPFDFIGHECRRLAISLANRYNIPADRLLAQPYHRLLELGFWGTLHDAAIIPSISLREDPEIVIETFRQYADQILGSSGCGYEGLLTVLVGAERVGGGTQAGRLGRALIPVTAIGFGIGLGVGVSLGLNTLTRGQAREDEGCDSQRFREWWSRLPPVTNLRNDLPAQFEATTCRQVTGAGQFPRRVPLSVLRPSRRMTVDADGADFSNCRLLDCKYSNPAEQRTPWRPDAYPLHIELLDLIHGYTTAVFDENPVHGFEIRTNENRNVPYFENVIITYGLVLNRNAFLTVP